MKLCELNVRLLKESMVGGLAWYNDKGLNYLLNNSNDEIKKLINSVYGGSRGQEYETKIVKDDNSITVKIPLPDVGAGGSRQSIALALIGTNNINDIKNMANWIILKNKAPGNLRYGLEKIKRL